MKHGNGKSTISRCFFSVNRSSNKNSQHATFDYQRVSTVHVPLILHSYSIHIPFIFHHITTGWWFGTYFIFPYIENVIIPTDELIFFRGVGQPPTRPYVGGCTPQATWFRWEVEPSGSQPPSGAAASWFQRQDRREDAGDEGAGCGMITTSRWVRGLPTSTLW